MPLTIHAFLSITNIYGIPFRDSSHHLPHNLVNLYRRRWGLFLAMALWIFGYGSLIWKAGFEYDDRVEGYIKDMERVFYQGFFVFLLIPFMEGLRLKTIFQNDVSIREY